MPHLAPNSLKVRLQKNLKLEIIIFQLIRLAMKRLLIAVAALAVSGSSAFDRGKYIF